MLPDAPREPTLPRPDLGGVRRQRPDLRGGQARLRRRRPRSLGRGAGRACPAAAGRRPGAAEVDLGPMISEGARDRFDAMIQVGGRRRGARPGGGAPASRPRLVLSADGAPADDPAPEAGSGRRFGPVVLVRGVADPDAAVAAANASPYGLAASVWGRDHRAARGPGAAARRRGGRRERGRHPHRRTPPPRSAASRPAASAAPRVSSACASSPSPRSLHAGAPGGSASSSSPTDPGSSGCWRLYRRLFHPKAR